MDDWRRTLAPWLEALGGDLCIRMRGTPTREEMEDLWIEIQCSDGSAFQPARWTLILEGLELLDLLVRVDANAGWSLIFSVAQTRASFAANEAALFRRDKVCCPRYVLSCISDDEIDDYFNSARLALSRMVGADDQPWHPSSAGFSHVQQLLLGAWASKHGGRDFDRAAVGRIKIRPHMLLTESPLAQRMTLCTLALAIASRALLAPDEQDRMRPVAYNIESLLGADQLHIRQQRGVFRFVGFDFHLLEPQVAPEVYYRLMHTSQQGTPIVHLYLDHLEMQQLGLNGTHSFFVEMLGLWSENGNGLKCLGVSCNRFDRDAIAAVCSALALSRGVTRFLLAKSDGNDDDEGDDNHEDEDEDEDEAHVDSSVWWPWLAYALFGQYASHTITDVELDVEGISMADVDAMRAVLEHQNPLAYDCSLDVPDPKPPGLSAPPKAVKIKPGTWVTIGHRIVTIEEEQCARRGTVTFTGENPLQVVRDDETEGFLEVVLPGADVGWINRTDVVEVYLCERHATNAVKRLELNCIHSGSRSAVLELLRLIGGRLEELTLFCFDDSMNGDFMTTVWDVCPRITNLRIHGNAVSVSRFVSLGESCCHLERLVLGSGIGDHDSVVSLIKVLSNENHALAKSLRAFHVCLHHAVPSEVEDEWLKMLRKNKRLEHCILSQHGFVAESTFQDHVRRHNGERILVPQTVAFLSAVADPSRRTPLGAEHHKNVTHDHPSVRFQLPHEAVELVLDFAGVPLKRICS